MGGPGLADSSAYSLVMVLFIPTQKHPRWSGGLMVVSGSSLGRTASASLPGGLGMLRMRFAIVGRLGLIPASPFLAAEFHAVALAPLR
jgi:hypothetical protein